MNFEEFKEYKCLKDQLHPFSPHYIVNDEDDFYIEPVCFTQLQGFKERHPDKYDLIIETLKKRVLELKKVVFVGDFENYFTEIDGYVYMEITDITNSLKIFVEDKSRGSDYGD